PGTVSVAAVPRSRQYVGQLVEDELFGQVAGRHLDVTDAVVVGTDASCPGLSLRADEGVDRLDVEVTPVRMLGQVVNEGLELGGGDGPPPHSGQLRAVELVLLAVVAVTH